MTLVLDDILRKPCLLLSSISLFTSPFSSILTILFKKLISRRECYCLIGKNNSFCIRKHPDFHKERRPITRESVHRRKFEYGGLLKIDQSGEAWELALCRHIVGGAREVLAKCYGSLLICGCILTKAYRNQAITFITIHVQQVSVNPRFIFFLWIVKKYIWTSLAGNSLTSVFILMPLCFSSRVNGVKLQIVNVSFVTVHPQQLCFILNSGKKIFVFHQNDISKDQICKHAITFFYIYFVRFSSCVNYLCRSYRTGPYIRRDTSSVEPIAVSFKITSSSQRGHLSL